MAFADNKTAVFPVRFIQGLPTININIQGKIIPMLVDTGANNTAITLDESIAKKLNVSYKKETISFGNACGEISTYKIFTIPKIYLGHLKTTNVPGYAYTKSPGCGIDAKIPSNIKGSVGLDFLKNFQLIFDFPNQKLVFFEGKLPDSYRRLQWQKIKLLKNNSGEMVVNSTIYDKDLTLLLDTGCTNSVLDPGLIAKANYRACSHDMDNDSNCEVLKVDNFIMNSKKVGELSFLTFKNLKICQAGIPYDGQIGVDFFNKHKVYVNWAQREIAISKNA